MADIAELTSLIEPEATALGLSLVRVALFGGKSDPTLQIMAERPDTRQLNLDDCAVLSRRISDVLDAVDPIEHAYRLEVSSPGIDRPLTRLQDYADWAGFEGRVRMVEAVGGRKVFEGKLAGVEGDRVKIDVPKLGETELPFDGIHSAKLLLTDALIDATMPLSSEGAEKFKVEG